MKSRRIPMTSDEFRHLERKPGWKYEYIEGTAYVSPREHLISCSVPTAPRRADSPWLLTTVGPEDAEGLLQAYFAAFRDGIEYCDWPDSAINQDARKVVQGILAGEHGELLPASRLARDHDRIIGTALIIERTPNTALLDAVYVIPDRQHRGLATVLVSDALSQLYATGFQTLESRYQLDNAARINGVRLDR